MRHHWSFGADIAMSDGGWSGNGSVRCNLRNQLYWGGGTFSITGKRINSHRTLISLDMDWNMKWSKWGLGFGSGTRWVGGWEVEMLIFYPLQVPARHPPTHAHTHKHTKQHSVTRPQDMSVKWNPFPPWGLWSDTDLGQSLEIDHLSSGG